MVVMVVVMMVMLVVMVVMVVVMVVMVVVMVVMVRVMVVGGSTPSLILVDVHVCICTQEYRLT
jgi:hypothetical protein